MKLQAKCTFSTYPNIMASDAILLRLHHKLNLFSHTVLALCISCLISSPASALHNQSYKLVTRQGFETSYPEEGGHALMTCATDDPGKDVYIQNEDGKPWTEKTKLKAELVINFTSSSIGRTYMCMPAVSGGYFTSPIFFCDPFLLIPPVQYCMENQVCAIDKANKRMCMDMKNVNCFLSQNVETMKTNFDASFPTYRTACVDTGGNLDKNIETYFGLCHARTNKKETQFVGLAVDHDECDAFSSFLLNANVVQEDGVLFESRDPSVWIIDVKSRHSIVFITCQLLNKEGGEVATFEGSQPDKVKYKKGSSKVTYPEKLKLHCKVKLADYSKVISTYIIVYSKNLAQYQPKLILKTEEKNKKKLPDLECSLTLPEGLFSVLWWLSDSEPKDQEKIRAAKNVPIKLTELKYEKHKSPVMYTCMAAIYAFEYPLSFKMVRLDDLTGNDTKLIGPKEFGRNETIDGEEESTKTKPEDIHKPDQSGDGKNPQDKDSNSGNSKVWIIIVATLIVLLLIAMFIAGALLYWKRSQKQRVITPSMKTSLKSNTTVNIVVPKIKSRNKEASLEFILSLFASMQKIIRACSGNMARALEKNVNFKRIKTEWDLLKAMPAPQDSGYIDTCRWPENVIIKNTWVYRNRKQATLLNQKPSRHGRRGKPKTLHMSKVQGIACNFLVCQAPLESEMILFLQVIADEKVSTILVLLDDSDAYDGLFGRAHNAFFPYFDISEGRTTTYGDYSLRCTLMSESRRRTDAGSLFQTRQLVLRNKATNLSSVIRILVYFGWKDFKSVSNVEHISEIYKFMKKGEKSNKDNTDNVLVHCSAGWGRSGTYVAAAICYQYLENATAPLSIFEVVKHVRSERYGAIQDIDQYVLVYWAVGHRLQTDFARQTPVDAGKSVVSTYSTSNQ